MEMVKALSYRRNIHVHFQASQKNFDAFANMCSFWLNNLYILFVGQHYVSIVTQICGLFFTYWASNLYSFFGQQKISKSTQKYMWTGSLLSCGVTCTLTSTLKLHFTDTLFHHKLPLTESLSLVFEGHRTRGHLTVLLLALSDVIFGVYFEARHIFEPLLTQYALVNDFAMRAEVSFQITLLGIFLLADVTLEVLYPQVDGVIVSVPSVLPLESLGACAAFVFLIIDMNLLLSLEVSSGFKRSRAKAAWIASPFVLRHRIVHTLARLVREVFLWHLAPGREDLRSDSSAHSNDPFMVYLANHNHTNEYFSVSQDLGWKHACV